jgi:hypothetical protein
VAQGAGEAPGLNFVEQDHKEKLRRAYTLVYHVVVYLGRSQEEGKAEQFLARHIPIVGAARRSAASELWLGNRASPLRDWR